MKELQNNFTTPEQSKRLLELGMPADSADLYYCSVGNLYNYRNPTVRRVDDLPLNMDVHIPCWSVGRLIEITEIMVGSDTWQDYQQPSVEKPTLVERAVCTIENLCNLLKFDFSKLFE